MILKITKGIINRKTLIFVFIFLFIAGLILAVIGTVSPDENTPIRIEFNTYSQYTNELNSFFNRTDTTALEDAQNKLIEDYCVRGYVILPKSPEPIDGYPVIIWMHGFSANAELQINYPRLFAKCGFLSIAISQPGHGCSGGFWDMGIQALLGVYSTVEWLVNNSNYKDIIDKTRIGVSGHSMGGIVTTRSGIFDNWTNPYTSNKVGTGGLIRSYGAVYCWDDLSTMASNLVSQVLHVDNVWNNPAILELLTQWRWLSNHDPLIIQEEIRIRSVSNFINGQNIPNYCLITGSSDELTTPEAQCYIMANATINASGIAEVPWDVIYNQVTVSSNHTWDYGDMELGNARRLVLVPDIGHLDEAFDHTVAQNLVWWFNQSMNCTDIDTNVPTNWNLPFMIKMGGWALMLIATLGCIFPIISYLSTSKIRTTTPLPSVAPKLKQNRGKSYLLYALIPIITIALSSFIRLQSITHFWIFDIIIPAFLVSGLFLLSAALILAFLELKQNKYELQDIGLSNSIKDNLKAILIPVLAILFCVAIFDIVCWSLQLSFLLPRPLDPIIYLDFFILLGILILLNFGSELLFRGLYQTKIENYSGRKVAKWKIVLKSGMFSGICMGIGFGIYLLITLGNLFINSPLIVVILFVGLILMFFLLGIASAFIYQRTRNILSSTIFNALILALFMAGKLLLTYA
ncbi:MAG TPA: alpha/beta fold hydrolase [Candidatus Deferrimicrobium sp.]|nr:alpha/beta fold hydrolase [Candidatus Deferrimicrobium sp.]